MSEIKDLVQSWIDNNAVFSVVTNYEGNRVKIASGDANKTDSKYDSGLIMTLYDKQQKIEITVIKMIPSKITGIIWYDIIANGLECKHYDILQNFKNKPILLYPDSNLEFVDYLQPTQTKIITHHFESIKNHINHENITLEVKPGIWFLPKDLDLIKDKNITLIYECIYDYVDLNRMLHMLLDNNNKVTVYASCQIAFCETVKSKIDYTPIHE